MQPRGTTLADLVDRYVGEIFPLKLWGRSKAADLTRLKRELGHHLASSLDYKILFDYFVKLREDGCGPVGIASQATYLIGVLETAADVWRLAVPVQAAKDVRSALKKLGMVKKSNVRERTRTRQRDRAGCDSHRAQSHTIRIRDRKHPRESHIAAIRGWLPHRASQHCVRPSCLVDA